MSERPSVRPLALGGSTCGPLEGTESSERAGEAPTEPELDKLELADIGLAVEVLLVVILDNEDCVGDEEATAGLCGDETEPVVDATANPVDCVGDEQAARTPSATTDAMVLERRVLTVARARSAPHKCMSQVINYPPFGLPALRLFG